MEIVIPDKKDLMPKPVSEGVYKCLITKMEREISKKGKIMSNNEYTIQSQGPDPAEKTIGRKVFDYVVIHPDTLWRVSDFLKKACGKDIVDLFGVGEKVTEDEIFMRMKNECLNKEVLVAVTVEMYKEEGSTTDPVPQNRVKGLIAQS